MIRFITQWLAHRRAIRRRWQADARLLAISDPAGSYYEAQRRAFHSRSVAISTSSGTGRKSQAKLPDRTTR
ncbi:hypothetical protein ACTOV4_21070 [Brucella sp. C7-11G]